MRRYDIDWLRVIAIGLLLIYHVAIGFQSWGTMIGFIACTKIVGRAVDTHGHAERMAHTASVFCVGHGGVFRYAATHVETID
jgi:hypothetical protein